MIDKPGKDYLYIALLLLVVTIGIVLMIRPPG